jgi:transposase
MSESRVEQLLKEIEQLRRENQLLRQKLDALARRIFGRKSEQLDKYQLEFLLGQLEQPSASAEVAIPEADTKPRRRSKPRRPRCPDDLPVELEIIDPPSVTENPSLYRQIGEEVPATAGRGRSEQLDYTPGLFFKRRIVRRTWVKRNDPDAVPVTAVLPPKLLERGLLAPGLLAHILVSKYTDHLPLYRQESIFYRKRHAKPLYLKES